MTDPGAPPRRVIVTGVAALLGSFALGGIALQSARGSRASERTPDARAKGEMLSRAIDKAYRDLPDGSKWHDISPVITPLIPGGTPYDLAEAILWEAGFGFTWSRRTALKPMDENLKRCLTLAARRRLVLWPPGQFKVSVTLTPDRRTKFDTVERTGASIQSERWT